MIMIGPGPRTTLCASLRSRNACQDFTRATLYMNLTEKCRAKDLRTPTLCEPAQSKRMSRFDKSHFKRKFSGETP